METKSTIQTQRTLTVLFKFMTRLVRINNSKASLKSFLLAFLLLCGHFTLSAATITVTNGNDAGAGSLRAAIASAVASDDIAFSGVTTVTLTSGQLTINKNLTINGGTGVTITRDAGAGDFRIFGIQNGMTVVFNKLTITNGKAPDGGGIVNRGTLTLNDCILANNQAGQGGGLQNDGTMTMNRCFVHSNTMTASGGGCGLLIYGSTTTLNNCVFTNNQVGWAIDIQSAGTLNITNCTVAKNTGGINIQRSDAVVTLKNTIVAENTNPTNPNILNNNVSASSAYNLIGTEGGHGGLTNGTNNNLVGISPMFANSSDPDGADNIFGTADDGLMLTACNLATNVGNNADAPSGTDIAGNTRIFNTTVDIGAYEFQANSSPNPTITLGTIPAILAGATSFTIPYTATSSPTTYSISGTGFSTVTDAALPSSPITVNLSAAASSSFVFTLTVKNANGCTSNAVTEAVIVNTPLAQACATATFTGVAPIAPTATTAGVGGQGGIHTYTVPAGVTAIRLDAKGAKGGSSLIIGGGTFNGGQGGRVQATYAVTPGDVLYILVGGKGGNGSPDNGTPGRTSSGGGGATVVSKGPIGSGTLLLVAGGGGGAGRLGGGGNSNNAPNNGSGFNGAGGASFSADGGNSNTSDDCGKGGQALNAGGYGGANTCFRPETNGGGYGGGGAGNYNTGNGNAGGGGGGGYVGGNAGATAGGNGGSSFTDASATNVATTNHSDDNGSVVISVAATISYTGSPFCKTLTATAAPTTTGYTGGTFSSFPTGLTIDATTGVINPSTSTAGSYLVSYNTLVGCTAATTTVRINTPPSISLTSPTNGSVFATNRTITVNTSDPNGSIARVNFYLVYYGDKAPFSRTLLGSSTTAPFSFEWCNIVGGNYNIQAEAIDNCGGSVFSTVVNVNVLETCTVLITSPTTGQGFVPGSNLTLAASVVSFTNRTITKVEFYKDNVKLGEDLTAPYTYSWMNVQSGSYYLRAVATDNMGGVWYSPYTYILGINPANKNASSQTSTSTVFTLFPNPTNSQAHLRTTISEEGNYNINIVDMMGRIVIAKQNNYAKGDLTESLDVSSLAKGIYLVRFVKENGKDAAIQKLIIE